jgi:predicted PurR-regulated permease PerM
MNAGQLAALIAAAFFAVLVCAAAYVLIKLARLASTVTGLVTDYRERTDRLLADAQAAVDRTTEQLARTDAITSSMDQVTSNMAELSGHVAALSGLARGLSEAATVPLHGMAALAFGLRRALSVRRSLRVVAVAEAMPERLPDGLADRLPAGGRPDRLPDRRAVTGR